LIEVDVIGAEPAQAGIATADDVMPRQPGVVGPIAHGHPHLGREQDVLAGNRQRLGDDLLGQSGRICVGGVDEVHARVERHGDLPPGTVDIGVSDHRRPTGAAECHRAEGQCRNAKARPAKLSIFHGAILPH
jgi:hypothetical protein